MTRPILSNSIPEECRIKIIKTKLTEKQLSAFVNKHISCNSDKIASIIYNSVVNNINKSSDYEKFDNEDINMAIDQTLYEYIEAINSFKTYFEKL